MSESLNERIVRQNYEKLTKLLISKNLTITTMESCTSGQIASLITDTEGSSQIIKGALVTYSNDMKIKFGVPKEIIDTYSVYSLETAESMATVSQKTFDADIGIGVTGTMGNIDPNNADFSKEGEVYFVIAFKGDYYKYKASIPYQESRLMYKLIVAQKIYETLISVLS